MELTPARYWRHAFRGLNDPVRSLEEALKDIIQELLIELLNPATTRPGQLSIVDRLALVRSIGGEQHYAALTQNLMKCLRKRARDPDSDLDAGSDVMRCGTGHGTTRRALEVVERGLDDASACLVSGNDPAVI